MTNDKKLVTALLRWQGRHVCQPEFDRLVRFVRRLARYEYRELWDRLLPDEKPRRRESRRAKKDRKDRELLAEAFAVGQQEEERVGDETGTSSD